MIRGKFGTLPNIIRVVFVRKKSTFKSHYLVIPSQMLDSILNAPLMMTVANHVNNIVGLFDVLPNVPFTTSERKRDC